MKYITKLLLIIFITFTTLSSDVFSASADTSDNRDFSKYLENTNYNKAKENSYEFIKLNDYMIPEGEEDEIKTINPSSDNPNNIDNSNNTDINNSSNESNSTEGSLPSAQNNTAENPVSETSSAKPETETSTSSVTPETKTPSETSTLTSGLVENESQTATPTVNSFSKNTNNSSAGNNNNTSEESFNKFDLAVSNLMVFLLFIAILLYKFSPKVKALIKLMTLKNDEI